MVDSDYTFGTASGPNIDDCHLLGYRGPAGEGFQPDRGESFVLHRKGKTISLLLKKEGWYTDLWRSPTGHVFVTDANGFIQHRAGDSGSWATESVGGMMVGVWGLDDQHLFAWGLRGDRDFMMRWDGQAWSEMPSPQGGVVAVHGSRPDLLVAVGDAGLIARWDGSAWTSMSAPSDEPLRSVFVVGDDEMYACGNRGGLVQGTVHGWTPVLSHDAPLASVARWHDAVWVGATGDAGLCRLEGDTLVSVKPNLTAIHLEANPDTLLCFNIGVIGHTNDGVAFTGFRTKGFQEACSAHVPPWA